MEKAIKYEIAHGRKEPKDVSKQKELGYDLESENRKIEVKGTSKPWNKAKNVRIILTGNESTAPTHIYFVCNVLKKPDLHIYDMEKIPPEAKLTLTAILVSKLKNLET